MKRRWRSKPWPAKLTVPLRSTPACSPSRREPHRIRRRPQLLRGRKGIDAPDDELVSPEAREREVRMVLGHVRDHSSRWGAVRVEGGGVGEWGGERGRVWGW